VLLAINGDLGSGKSELAGRLSVATGWRIVSMGGIQRSVAESLGISTLEMNLRAEADPSIDERLRREVEALRDVDEDLIVDSRLAFHFLPEAPSVHLVSHPHIAAERVLHAQRGSVETYLDVGDAQAQLIGRRAAERARYRSKFGVAIERFRNYQLVLQTDFVAPEQVFSAAQNWLATPVVDRTQNTILLNPSALLPATADRRDLFDGAGGIGILRVGDLSYIANGVESVRRACEGRDPFVTVSILAQDDESINGRTATEWVADVLIGLRIDCWEAQTGVPFDRRLLDPTSGA
jgi:cytidylate kinase